MGREGNNFAREAEIQSAAALVVPRSCLPISHPSRVSPFALVCLDAISERGFNCARTLLDA